MSEFDQRLTGFRFVDINFGDTLQQIAARELGDASRWPDLANINELLPPYVTDDPLLANAAVLLSGSQILVPSQNLPGTPYAKSADDIYEIDIDVSGGFLTDDGSGDFLVAAGVTNLRQALRNRVVTETGELLFHQSYGCRARTLIGQVNGPLAEVLAAEYVTTALIQDPRVQEVSLTVATASGDVLSVVSDVVPISGKSTKIEAIL